MEKIKSIIKSVLEDEFNDVEIISIDIREDEDFEGDEVLRVTVVFSSSGRLDSKATAGFIRHVRPFLNEIHENRFPVMSFVSDDDYGQDRIAETA